MTKYRTTPVYPHLFAVQKRVFFIWWTLSKHVYLSDALANQRDLESATT